uniref:Phosphatidylcholine transfer protein n=2 Tax=Cacopsylla melanoneura TaxID=428564 RepID=A0A8D8LL97_9HEMI
MFAISSVKLFQQFSSNAHLIKTNVRPNQNLLVHVRSLNTRSSSKLWNNSRILLQGLLFEGRSAVSYQRNLQNLKQSIHKHYMLMLKHCCKQIEFIFAHRLRRCQQIMLLYSKWWDELRLKHLIENMKRQIPHRNKLMLSYGVVSCLNIKSNENVDYSLIKDTEFSRYSDEINRVYFLKGIAPKPVESIKNVKCISPAKKRKTSPCKCSRCRHGTSVEGWVEIYNKDNLTFWKKEHLDHKGKGLYCYKVYGYFTDITAEDFLQVQINVDFRKEWDKTAIELSILDQDPKTKTDVVYWELRFPRFFTNRDYVFLRRCQVDEERKVITIINQSTNHAQCPPKQGKHRVKEFWSYMVIKPSTEFDQPGLEFVITYFDNPGIRMPTYISSWLTFTEMPDFIGRQRNAAIAWSKRKGPQPSSPPSNPNAFPEPNSNPTDDRAMDQNQSKEELVSKIPPAPGKHNPPPPSYYQMIKNSISYVFYST